MKWLYQLYRDERGQSTTEYILILAVVVMLAMKFKSKFQGVMDGAITNLETNMQDVLK